VLYQATFECLDWLAPRVDIGPVAANLTCIKNEWCILNGLEGINLQKNDGVMLLTSCQGGTTLTGVGYPAGRLDGGKCGAEYNFGRLPAGTAEMCWCPVAIDCGSDPAKFTKHISTLRVDCPPGYYYTGTACASSACAAPANVANAPNPSCTQGSTLASGTSCVPSCAGGGRYIPSERSLSCYNAVLTPPTFSCDMTAYVSCPAPTGIRFGADLSCAEGAFVSHGRTCTSQCAAGYNPTISSLDCDDGSLKPSSFTCEEAPCLLPAVADASPMMCQPAGGANVTLAPGQRLSEIESLSKCQTVCLPGYVPMPPTLSCSKGELTPATFTCTKWLDQEAIKATGFGPVPFKKTRGCGMEESCVVNIAVGTGLQEGDRFMLPSNLSHFLQI